MLDWAINPFPDRNASGPPPTTFVYRDPEKWWDVLYVAPECRTRPA
jgi:hypothetical protein